MVRIYDNEGVPVADLQVNLGSDVDWTNLRADSNLVEDVAYMHYPGGFLSIPSATGSGFWLYVPYNSTQNSVLICPGASSSSEVNLTCNGGYLLNLDASNVALVVIDGQMFWQVAGLTGTGGLGLDSPLNSVLMSLTPNISLVSESLSVVASYTTTDGFISGSQVQITWEAGAVTSLATTCNTRVDGFATTSGNVYTFTFSTTTPAGSYDFCMNVAATSTVGNYAVTLLDAYGNYAANLFYVGSDNQVNVIGKVAPTLSFNIRNLDDSADTNLCDFGSISTATLAPNSDLLDDSTRGECGYGLAVGTNAQNGFIAQIASDGSLRNSNASIMNVVNGTAFAAGTESYGLASVLAAASGRNTSTGAYDQSATWDGGFAGTYLLSIPTVATNMFEYSDGFDYTAGGVSTDLTKVMHGLVVSAGTPAGSYSQVVTYTVTARF
jgi:hypothetical protein